MNISHPIDPQIFLISLSKLGQDINYHKKPKNSYLIQFHYHYLHNIFWQIYIYIYICTFFCKSTWSCDHPGLHVEPPLAPILFNHIYLFTKKYQNINHELFRVSMNISHPIHPQIFLISLSKLGHDINYHKKPKNSYLIQFHYHYLAKPKTGPMILIHTSHSF